MNRELVLVASLYNGGILSVLDFVVQCSEMFKDDVFSWSDGAGCKTAVRFSLYQDKFGRFDYRRFRKIRNSYIHSFDESIEDLYLYVSALTLLDIKGACEYFGIKFESGRILGSLQLICALLEHMKNLEELDGSKES